MGNNIELKYSNLNTIATDINAANRHLENAMKTLKKSTDLGSSLAQAFWKFGSKESIFGAIRNAVRDLDNEISNNKRLVNCLNNVDNIYESAGKKSRSIVNNKYIIRKVIASLIFANFPNLTLFSSIVGIVYGCKTISKISSKKAEKAFILKPINLWFNPFAKYPPAQPIVPPQIVQPIKPSSKPDVKQIIQKMEYHSGQCLDGIWKNWGPVSPNGFTNYNGKGNCTWYADQRWSQNNPNNPLVFNGNGGNAKNWINSINRDKFNVFSTSDINNIKANSIAVSQSGYYGHVAYVEQVKDGRVFYTEDGESYTRPHTWQKDANGNWVGPTVQSCTLEEFKRKFGNIITAK